MPDDPAIETRELTKVYGARAAVSDLALEVRRGEVFGFLGQNGAGKTTTIRLLLGLVRPTRGEVRLFGRDLARERLALLARTGALVEGPSFYPFLSAERNLVEIGAATAGPGGLSGKALVARARECLERVGLLDRKDDLYRGYSRGMKQRLGIALAVLHRPELVILDEPLNGLDPPAVLVIRALIRDLVAKEGATVFVSSHLLNEVELSCDRVAIIEQGKLVAQGGVRDLLQRERDLLEVDVPDPEAALETARALPFVYRAELEPASRDGNAAGAKVIVVETERGRAADLNRALVEAGRAVRALVPRRLTLEELFHAHVTEARARNDAAQKAIGEKLKLAPHGGHP